MRALSLGLLAGVLWLQCRAALPDTVLLIALFALSLLLGAAAVLASMKASLIAGGHSCCGSLISLLLCLFAGISLGISSAGLRAHHRLQYCLSPSLEGRDILVVGEVHGLPDVSKTGTRFVFHPQRATLPDGSGVTVPTALSLGWYAEAGARPPALRSGETWQLTLRLKRPHGLINPSGFDAEAWMLNEHLRATGYVRPAGGILVAPALPWWQSPGAAIDNLRAAIRDKINDALSGRAYAGVIVALVVGDQRAIGQTDWDVFAKTGIGHLVSISGLHITMISALVAAVVHYLWRYSFFTRASLPLRLPAQKAALGVGLLAAAFYVALAGFGIPAQRTLLMLGVATVALWSNRTPAVSQILSLSLMAVLLLDPWSVLWPGFWLSFVAIACILFASAGRGRTAGVRRSGMRTDMMASSMSSLRSAATTQWVVTVGLLPVSIAWFAQISLVGPLANAIAIPLISFAVTPLALLGGMMPAPGSAPLLRAAHALMSSLADWLNWLASADWALWQAPQPGWAIVAVAMAGTLWALAPRGWPLRWLGLLCWLPLLLAGPDAPRQGVWLTAFDVGQGNALLVETPRHRLLYDTGPAFSSEADGGSRVLLPYLRARGISSLDAMVISHSDKDHSGGARSVWEGVRVGWLTSSLPPGHPLLAGSPPHIACRTGQVWIWDDVRFEMLHPSTAILNDRELRPNARSCTLKISYRERSVLLTGDIEAPQERALITHANSVLRSDVLLAPHHGSGTSSTHEFLDAVQPAVAIFQVGYRNRYRHPKTDVLARYEARDIQVFRTDQSGAVRVEMDETLRIHRYRCERLRYWSTEPCTHGRTAKPE